jgi:hypothetical protein
VTWGEGAAIAYAVLAAEAGRRWLVWWDRRGPPAPPSRVFAEHDDEEPEGDSAA